MVSHLSHNATCSIRTIEGVITLESGDSGTTLPQHCLSQTHPLYLVTLSQNDKLAGSSYMAELRHGRLGRFLTATLVEKDGSPLAAKSRSRNSTRS